MKKFFLPLLLLSIFAFISCDNTPEEPVAFELNAADIPQTPGFGWFYAVYDTTQVDTNLVSQIKDNFDPAVHRFYLYIKPSCSCPGTHVLFPKYYKILKFAGVPDSSMEIYSMSSDKSRHKYEQYLIVNAVPSFYVVKNGTPIYSVLDTLDINEYLNRNGLNLPTTLEELTLLGLKK